MRYPKSNNLPRGEAWHKKHKYPGKCAKCGKEGEKSTMSALYVRKHNDSHRILCRLCDDCMNAFCVELNVELPEPPKGEHHEAD